MEQIYTVASLWLTLAVVSAVIAYHLRISIALVEICVGVVAAAVASSLGVFEMLHADAEWLRFLASSGAVLLTFLAGAELDPVVIRTKVKEVTVVGLIGFLAPFLGCTAIAYYGIGWDLRASWLCGVALSTTSMAVVYAVMLETGLNKTEFGKGILGACFINDLGTVIALGLLFAPFTYKTVVFVVVSARRPGPLALHDPCHHQDLRKPDGRDPHQMGHPRPLRAGRPGPLVRERGGASRLHRGHGFGRQRGPGRLLDAATAHPDRRLPHAVLLPARRDAGLAAALVATPLIFVVLLAAKVASKIFGLYPVIARFRRERNERWYYTLLMSTGLTFGTISALYGLTHGIVTQGQYSFLVAAVIASAVVPTLIAGMAFLPKHLLPSPEKRLTKASAATEPSEEG